MEEETKKSSNPLIAVVVLVLLVGVTMFYNFMNNSAQDGGVVVDEVVSSKTVVLTTNMGVIELEMFEDKAPKTVANFTKLAQEGFYNGTRFHRVIEGFMIQGGDPLSKDEANINSWGTGGPGYSFEDEIHDENLNNVGTISMANAGPNTNGSQFFINVNDNNSLDTKHTVFGKVISGMDIVMKISQVNTEGADRPVDEVVLETIEIK